MNAPLVLRKAGLFIWDYLPRHYPIFKRQCNRWMPMHTYRQSSKNNAINERQGTLMANLQKTMQSIDANALSQPFIKAMDLIDRVKNQMMQKCISRPKLKGQKEMHRMPMRRLAQHQRRGAFDHLFYPLLLYFEMHSIISLPISTPFKECISIDALIF